MKNNHSYEAVIVGGSYAGLSAAMALGRASRNILIIDSGQPCNAQTPHSHNFITHDGEKPAVIRAKAKTQVLQYPTIEWLDDQVVEVAGKNNDFTTITTSGKNITSKKVLFATGVRDMMPNVEGFKDCWGISVLHCPYCHGYEVKGERTAIMANGEMGFHLSMVLTQWTKDLVLFTNGPSTMDAGQVEKLSQHNITIIENELKALEHKKGYLENILLVNGEKHAFKVMYAKIPFELHSLAPVRLGCELNEHGLIKVDPTGKTTVPGIFAAGDGVSMARTVSIAVASGTMAGIGLNGEMISDVF